MNAGPSKKSIRQQSVFVADLLDPDTSGWNDDDDEIENYHYDDDGDDDDDDDDGDDDDLVDFLPSLEVLGADETMVVKQCFGDNGDGWVDHRVVNRRQALPVPIVWAAYGHGQNVKTFRGEKTKRDMRIGLGDEKENKMAPGSKL